MSHCAGSKIGGERTADDKIDEAPGAAAAASEGPPHQDQATSSVKPLCAAVGNALFRSTTIMMPEFHGRW